MLRGINQQEIFHDEEDYNKFLQVLSECKTISGFELYAYCIMGNHVHLLIKEINEPIDLIFKRIGSRYVYWYNIKYKRVGHLFQDRYKSCAVETDEYFFSALRYIHNNPVAAGICETCKDYKFCSYNSYFNESNLVDSKLVLDMISFQEFEKFHLKTDNLSHLELAMPRVRITDEEAKRIIEFYSGCSSIEQYQKLPLDKQEFYIRTFKDEDMSVRQIN